MKVKKMLAAAAVLTIMSSVCFANGAVKASSIENQAEHMFLYDKVTPYEADYSNKPENDTGKINEGEQGGIEEESTENSDESTSESVTDTSEPADEQEEPSEESTTEPTEPTEPTELTEPTTEPSEETTENKEQYEEIRNNLAAKVEELKSIDESKYTKETFEQLQKSILAAEEILTDWDNRYFEAEKALKQLEKDFADLVTYESLLENAVAEGEKILPDWYTEESFAVLETALENGRNAIASGSTDSETTKKLISDIETAVKGLYNIKDKLTLCINEAKSKYDLLYVEDSLQQFKAEISRIEDAFTENITPEEVKQLIDDVKNAYSLLKCVLGDANLSGSINVQDATALQRFIAGLDLKIEPSLSDVNYDGAITVSDATRIQEYVAGLIDGFEKEPQLPDYDKEWNLVLVNYKYPIKSGYVPKLRGVDGRATITFDVRAADALEKMLSDCRAEGLSPLICSAYRTQSIQEKLFNNRVDRYVAQGYSYDKAVELAKTSVAYPGTSEHQLGLAVDIVSLHYQILDEGQLKTKEQQWLMKNCWKYGFILRYPTGKQDITGVIFEPWHYRYVGVEAAKEITEKGITLEEYLGFI